MFWPSVLSSIWTHSQKWNTTALEYWKITFRRIYGIFVFITNVHIQGVYFKAFNFEQSYPEIWRFTHKSFGTLNHLFLRSTTLKISNAKRYPEVTHLKYRCNGIILAFRHKPHYSIMLLLHLQFPSVLCTTSIKSLLKMISIADFTFLNKW